VSAFLKDALAMLALVLFAFGVLAWGEIFALAFPLFH